MKVSRRALLKAAAVGGAAAAAGAVADRTEARERREAGPDDVGLLCDSTRCVGCRACVTRCKEANGLPPDVKDGMYDAPPSLSATTKNVVQVADVGAGRFVFVKSQCMHCIDPSCVSVCMAGALHQAAGGIVAYDADRCVGCRYCQVACAFSVPKFEWNEALPKIVKCELCRHRGDARASGPLAVANPACAEVCPRGAVVYGKRSELLELARARIAADAAAYNPRVYGVTDGGGTHVVYLAARGVEFEALGLPKLPDEPLPEMGEHVQHSIYKWFAAPTLLYGALAYAIVKNRKRLHEQEEEHR